MRIYSIANNKITFGYNKSLNNQVNKKLETAEKDIRKSRSSRAVARDLRTLNLECMSLEDKLRSAERDGNKAEVDFYKDIFISAKLAVAEKIDARYPLLNYLARETMEYQQEIIDKRITDKKHWLPSVTAELTDMLAEQQMKAYEDTPAPNTVDKAVKPVQVANPEEKAKTLVEEFKPNEFSPDGFASVAAMQDMKDELYDKIIMPIRNPQQAELDRREYGKKFPRGIMFYGPSGCGKTYLMEAIAIESGVPLYKFKVSRIGSTLVNGSAIKVQEAYDIVKKAAVDTGKPVLLMMDEMEGLTAKRNETGSNSESTKVIGTLLQIMDDARGDNVIILASTNFVNLIDPAIRSRIDNSYYFGLPDADTRDKVLEISLNKFQKGRALASNPQERAKVVAATKGFSIRDITVFIDKAADIARLDGRRDIVAEDFLEPIAKNQSRRVNENLYKDSSASRVVGFSPN